MSVRTLGVAMRCQATTSKITSTSGHPLQHLAVVFLWAVIVNAIANAVSNFGGVEAAQLDVEWSLSGGMPSINTNIVNEVSRDDNHGKLDTIDNNVHSSFTIESDISSPSISRMTYVPRNQFSIMSNNENNMEDKRTPTTNKFERAEEKNTKHEPQEVPSILPFVEMFMKNRQLKQKNIDNSALIPFTSMNLITRKRSESKKTSIKHVLKVTNDLIQPEVHRPGVFMRVGKRTAGLHSKSISFEMNPSQPENSLRESIPKMNYDLKDVFYSLDSEPVKSKRQDEVTSVNESSPIISNSQQNVQPDTQSDISTNKPLFEATNVNAASQIETTNLSDTVVVNSSGDEKNDHIVSTSPNDSFRSSDPQVKPPGHDMVFDPIEVPHIPLGQLDTVSYNH